MERRNQVRDWIWRFAIALLAAMVLGQARDFWREQKTYAFAVYANEDLTAETVGELRKLAGIQSFFPVDTMPVTIRLGGYTLTTELLGVEFSKYPLQWETAQQKVSMSNTPKLFWGKEMFSRFADEHGFAPSAGQIEKWVKGYEKLELTLVDESGRERKAGICGILRQPEDRVCMEKGQMREVFGELARTMGGVLNVRGYWNVRRAKEVLEGVGISNSFSSS